MPDFSTVTDFCVRFTDHHVHPLASRQLNSLYATSLDDPTAFFVDPATCDEIRPDTDLVSILRVSIVEEVIYPLAQGHTTGVHPIRLAISSCPLSVCQTMNSHLGTRRLNARNLEFYLTHALRAPVPSITFIVDINQLYFDFDADGNMNFLDWTRIGPVAFPAPPAPPASAAVPPALTAADLQAAVASLTGLATAVTTGISVAMSTPAAPRPVSAFPQERYHRTYLS